MSFSQKLISVSAALAVAFLAGCSTFRPETAENLAPADPYGALPLYDRPGNINMLQPQASVLQTTLRRKDVLNVLVISGGGSHGAFGAGVLSGWSESGSRPKFDVVTGVSTGALIAPLAFLGKEYDDVLAAQYTQASDSDIFNSRGIFGLVGPGLNSNAPLRARLKTVIDDEVISRIAIEHRRGRRLYVGTTDLDTGEAVTWDMGGLAASQTPHSRERFIDILVASTAVPGLFDPVMITQQPDGSTGRRLHVDGGVKAPVLLRDFMIAGPYRSKNVYLLVNSCVCLRNIKEPVKPTFVSVSSKGIEELLRSFLYRSLQTSMAMAQNAGGRASVVYIPDAITPPDPFKFDRKEMLALFEVGRASGRARSSWLTSLPRSQRYSF